MKNNPMIFVIGALVIGAAVGFFGGMKYQSSKAPQTATNTAGGRFQGRGGGTGANGARPVAGEILSQDDKSITVKLQDGSSKIVFFSNVTAINKAATATKDDLKVGMRVAAFGSANSDGSITASNIQLNPMGRMGGGNPDSSPKPSP